MTTTTETTRRRPPPAGVRRRHRGRARAAAAAARMAELNVFGIVEAAEAQNGAPEGTRYVVHGEVAALVSDLEEGPQRAAHALRTHWRVLETASAETTVLPVRFGTAMADEAALRDEFL